jgi:hypothetical protein
MQDTSKNNVLTGLLKALRPIARFLMKSGIGYREFAEISKSAFVDVATSDYGLRGRPTNIPRPSNQYFPRRSYDWPYTKRSKKAARQDFGRE